MSPVRHEFGGFWTAAKLDRVGAYLPYFTREMGTDFHTAYFDAFAGTGAIDQPELADHARPGFFVFPAPPPIVGSARRALETDPLFDRYVFVDHDIAHRRELRRLRENVPHLKRRIRVRKGDANDEVVRFCKMMDWSVWRAVFFLDPYGLEVEWRTIEAIAKTEAADAWILFPIGSILRMLPRDEKPTRAQRACVNRAFGEKAWFSEFYRTWEKPVLVGDPIVKTTRHAGERAIKKYFMQRLQSVFTWVSEKPLLLFANRGPTLFHLYFASSIPGRRTIYATVQNILSIPSTERCFSTRFEKLQQKQGKRTGQARRR